MSLYRKKIRLRVWNKGMSSFMLSKNIIFVNSEEKKNEFNIYVKVFVHFDT